jgi:multiple sugar transport system permease protein
MNGRSNNISTMKNLRRFSTLQKRFGNIGHFLMILPAMLVLISLIIYPLIYSLNKSFTDFNLGMAGQQFVGLRNYQFAFIDPSLRNSFFVSIKYSFFAVTAELILGFGAALLLRQRFQGASLVTVLLLLPMMVTPVVVGIIWLLMFQPGFSTINGFLLYLGIEGPIWLQNPRTALFAIIVADVWQWTPFFMIVLLAGLLNLPEELLEAAKVDGASGLKVLWFIIIPLMTPLIMVVLLIRIIDSFKVFDPIFVMTNGGPGEATQVLSLLIYRTGLPYMNISYASAMSYLFLIFLTIATTLLINQLHKTR